MFTREHFEAIASALTTARRDIQAGADPDELLDILAESFADIFAESNPRFSKRAFIGACNAASRSEIRRLVVQNNKRLAG